MKSKSKYKIQFDNITPGDLIHSWIILDNYLLIKNNKLVVKCLCSNCNTTINYVRVDNLVANHTKKCIYCINKEKGFNINSTYKGIINSVFNKIKASANKRNLEFDITVEDIGDLFEKQEGKCALTGIKLKLKESYLDNTSTASLDRIKSSEGYLKNNIQWVHKEINFLKGSLTEKRLIELCELIVKNKLK